MEKSIKTLAFIKTHILNKAIIDEYTKLHRAKNENIEAILFIDNHTHFLETDEHCTLIEENDEPNTKFSGFKVLKIYGKKVNCFIFDKEIFKTMKLPYYTKDYKNRDFKELMWFNCDYPLYVMQKYFPDFDYYWQIEYDVFMNGNTYQPFFKKFENNDCDLIANYFNCIKDSDKYWGCKDLRDWIYEGKVKYSCIFPVVRLSAKAAQFLYKRRLEHREIFKEYKYDTSNCWVYCESFVPTELGHHGFKCMPLEEDKIRIGPVYNLKEDCCFNEFDNRLYHPIK